MSINPKPHLLVGIFHVLNTLRASKKLFEMKTNVFILKWFSNPNHRLGLKNCWTTKYLYFGGKVLFKPKPQFGFEKLHNIKTYRFYGKVFLGCHLPKGEMASKKLKSFSNSSTKV